MRRIPGFLIVFCLSTGLLIARPIPQGFDKAAFYEVMKSGDITAVENQLEAVKTAPAKDREGYSGALLLKKAGLLKKPKDRLSFFKAGRIKLETALSADNDNTEFHFLRLAIEERAPKIVKYHLDIEKDKVLIIKNFKDLGPTVQHAILDYSNSSKVLHKEDFSSAKK